MYQILRIKLYLSLSLFISMISSSGWAGLGAGPGWVEADLCRVEQGEGLGVSLQVVGALSLVCTVHYFAVLYCTYPVLYVLYLGVGEGETVPGAVPALRLVPLSRRLGLTLRLPPPEQWSDTRAFKYFFFIVYVVTGLFKVSGVLVILILLKIKEMKKEADK